MNTPKNLTAWISEILSIQLKLTETQREISSFMLEVLEENEIKEEDDEYDHLDTNEDSGNEDIDKKGYYQKKSRKRKSRK